jgi:hypothetical protein
MSDADWLLLLLAVALRICRLSETSRVPSRASGM